MSTTTYPQPQPIDLLTQSMTPQPQNTPMPPMPSAQEIEKLMHIANAYANSGMHTKDCRTAEGAFMKMLFGRSLGFDPAVSLYRLEYYDSRLTIPSAMMVSSIRQRGLGDVKLIKTTHTEAVCEVVKNGVVVNDSLSFTIDDAKTADLANKTNWKRYQQSMLAQRVMSMACKLYFQELFYGISSADELGAETDEMGRAFGEHGSSHLPAFATVKAPWEVKKDEAAVDQSSESIATPAAAKPLETGENGVSGNAGGTGAAGPVPHGTNSSDTLGMGNVAVSTDSRADQEQIEEAKILTKIVGPTQQQWLALLARYGAKSFKELSTSNAKEVLHFLDNIRNARLLRVYAGIDDAKWAEALSRRNVSHELELTTQQAQELTDKLFEKFTPFDLDKLGVSRSTEAGEAEAKKA